VRGYFFAASSAISLWRLASSSFLTESSVSDLTKYSQCPMVLARFFWLDKAGVRFVGHNHGFVFSHLSTIVLCAGLVEARDALMLGRSLGGGDQGVELPLAELLGFGLGGRGLGDSCNGDDERETDDGKDCERAFHGNLLGNSG